MTCAVIHAVVIVIFQSRVRAYSIGTYVALAKPCLIVARNLIGVALFDLIHTGHRLEGW